MSARPFIVLIATVQPSVFTVETNAGRGVDDPTRPVNGGAVRKYRCKENRPVLAGYILATRDTHVKP